MVVKVLRPTKVGDLDGLRREATILRRLAHPMLLRASGAQLRGERPNLVLEHIEGRRLSTLMRRYGLSLEQALPLALNLCAVLHYLEQEDVVHLDVKPSNIVMGGEPCLIDLSIARRLDELRALRSPVGTELWMAPEQRDVERFGEIGPASDVWGLGATLRRHEGAGDATRGDDGTGGGNNTGDGDRTRGNDGTRGGDNTGDGDATWGNDGSGDGDNSYVAPAAGGGGCNGDDDSGGGSDG